MERFVDLGVSWFLYENDEECLPHTVVCDAISNTPDHYFGPAAWGKATGPVSGQTILEAHPVAQGRWTQVGSDEWKWISSDGQECSEAPASWPRCITVKAGRAFCVLKSLSGKVVQSEDDLIEHVRHAAATLPARMLQKSSEHGRLGVTEFVLGNADRVLQ